MTDSLLRVCRPCARYTFKSTCPDCGVATRTPHPARYNPSDRYGKYRRLLLQRGAAPGGRGE